ncbi:MAG: hypothetical protein K6T66_01395 [Peptococcaceae bacterium]|nr:hypothetical protein [Peptococcaceae bacterium]
MGKDTLDEKSCLALHEIALELKNMLDGITHDFYRHREEYLSEVKQLSDATVSSMKKSVLSMPIIAGASLKEAAGRYEVMRDLEYIRLNLEKIMRATREKLNRSVLFSNWAVEELNVLFAGAGDGLTILSEYLKQCAETNRERLENETEKLLRDISRFSQQHEDRFMKGVCTPESAAIYQSMLDAFRDIFRHIKSCVVKVFRY